VPTSISLTRWNPPRPAQARRSAGGARGEAEGHHQALAERDYPSQFPNALDYVVLFVPANRCSARRWRATTIDRMGGGERILLATPASLIALLRFSERELAAAARDGERTENSRAAQGCLWRLYVHRALEKIRGGLETANRAFNQAVGSYESRIKPSGREIAEARGGTAERSGELPPLDATLRLPPG